MIPVLFKVFPKPSWIAVMASDGDILPIRPVISAASSSAMKVWVLVFITRKIMIAMPKNRPSSIWVSCDIFHTSFCSVLTSYASLLFTHCANSNGFCRCFAFQIGKICFHGCIIRHFQFRKCLPMYSNYASNMGGCIRKAAVARL